jgi:hypothetical protein
VMARNPATISPWQSRKIRCSGVMTGFQITA